MTTQSNAGNSNREHARLSIWGRLSPFLDVIGAVLIFGSWIFSHTLLQRAQYHGKAHEAMIERVRQFRLYDDFATRISSIQSDLARTRNLVEHGAQDNDLSGGTASSLPEVSAWTGMTQSQLRELMNLVDSLDQYAGQLSVSQDVIQSLQEAQSAAGKLSKAFDSARDEYDQLVEKRKASTSAADSERAAEEGEELRRRVDHLWHNYDTAKQDMLQVSDKLLQTADAESESAGQLAKQCERLSWVLYTVGTLIILFGRAKSVFADPKTT